MKTRIKFSRLLQIGLLLTFFLPFFPKACESKQTDVAPKADSTIVAVSQESGKIKQADTLKTSVVKNIAENDGLSNDEKYISKRLSHKSPILKTLLRPNDTYTGIGFLLDYSVLLRFGYGLGLAFVLWIIGLIIKYKDYNNIFNMINIIGFILLCSSNSIFNIMNDTRLWGFWTCVIWSGIMIIYDSIILLQIRKNRRITST